MITPLLQAAIEYQRRGFSLVPFQAIPPKPGTTKWKKKPFVKWESRQEQAPDEKTVISEFKKFHNALIGVVTGKVSGICTLDIDDDEGRAIADELVPDSQIVPTFRTMSGGLQMMFRNPEPSIPGAVRFLPGLDFRGEGSLAILPPSSNGQGGDYQWLDGLVFDAANLSSLPDALRDALYNNINNNTYREHVDTLADSAEMFADGRRDNDLFHVANHLVKGGMPDREIKQVLERLIVSWGETPDHKWVDAKIVSALKRADRRERNLAQEVREWVLSTSGVFLSTEIYNCLQVSTREEKKNVSIILKRLENGIIEKYGNKNGCYRRIENDVEPVNFLSAPTDEFPIIWPMDIDDQCIIYPGNIIIVAGSKSAGKTGFLLNTVKLNMNRNEIVYLNSEMGDTEFRKRLELFEDVPLQSWKFKAYHRSSNFADLVTSEKKIFIVDFLEVTTDFWKVAQYIQEIHNKLRDGICIIALQKSDNKDTGRGGDFSKEKARLYLSLDYLSDLKVNRVKITDAKAWRTDRNPRGLYRHYKLVKGSHFIHASEWRDD